MSKASNKRYAVDDSFVGQQKVYWNVVKQQQQKVLLRKNMTDMEIQKLVREGLSSTYFIEFEGVKGTISLSAIESQRQVMNATMATRKRKKVTLKVSAPVAVDSSQQADLEEYNKIKKLAIDGFGGDMAKAFALKAKTSKSYTKADIEAIKKAFEVQGNLDKEAAFKTLN